MKSLENKVAIITASLGISKSTVLLFAEQGARFVLTDLDVKQGNKVVKDINEAGGIRINSVDSVFIETPILKPEDIENLA